MAYADSARAVTATLGTIAGLIEGIPSSGYPLTFSTWTPTLSVVAPGTFTATTILMAKYFRIGKVVVFMASFSGTIGGTPPTIINMTLPVTAVSQGISAAVQITDGGAIVGGCCSILTTSSIDIRRYNAAAFTAGTVGPTLYGFYEVP